MRFEIQNDKLMLSNESGQIHLSREEQELVKDILKSKIRIKHNVKELRTALHMTQSELARKIGQWPSNISTIESQPYRQLSAGLKSALARALHCKPEDVQP